MNLWLHIPSKYILLAILAVAFLLRVNNLTIGFPMLYVSNDEAIYHQSALNMIANRTPFTLGNYGPLGAYVQVVFLMIAFGVMFATGVIHSSSDLVYLLATQEGYLLFIPRVISAMFGTLSVLVVYLLSKELFGDRKAALWSALFFALSFNFAHVSHLARAWSPAIFFVLCAVLFAVKSVKNTSKKTRYTMIAFVMAALAFGFHQLSGIVVLLIILIKIFGKTQAFAETFRRDNLFSLGIWFFLIIFFNFLSVGAGFFGKLSPSNSSVGLIKVPIHINLFKFSGDLILTDGVIAFLTVIFFLIKRPKNGILLAFGIFLIINFIASISILPPFVRYFMVALSIFPLFAGYVISQLVDRLIKINKHLAAMTVILVMFAASFDSLYWNLLLLKHPTFDQVRVWLDANIDQRVPIGVTARRSFDYVPTASASAPIRKLNANFYLLASKVVGDNYGPNVRNVLYLDQLKGGSKSTDLTKGLEVYPVLYVVDPYLSEGERLINQKTNVKLKLIAHFSPTGKVISKDLIPQALFDAPYNLPFFKVDRVGPYFDVLRVE